jgi:hypothetical protein
VTPADERRLFTEACDAMRARLGPPTWTMNHGCWIERWGTDRVHVQVVSADERLYVTTGGGPTWYLYDGWTDADFDEDDERPTIVPLAVAAAIGVRT